MEGTEKPLRGFARMSPEERRELARRGGAAEAPEDRSFSKNRKIAVNAGKKGGVSVPHTSRSFYKDRNLAAKAGKKGGQISRRKGKDK